MQHSILIAGPTASGKSAFSLMLAEKLNGVVINADSMQVYRDLRILTARPSVEEEGQAPHKLYGYLDASEVCSAADWTALAIQEIRQAQKNGQVPIVVGGTGMYFRFLLEGVAEIPDIDPEIRTQVRQWCENEGSAVLHEWLKGKDPDLYTRLHPSDSQRICRAVEVYQSTGRALGDWQKNNKHGPLYQDDQKGLVHKYVLTLGRDDLYDRCNRRFDIMVQEGALDEVAALKNRHLDSKLPCMKSLGYPELSDYLSDKLSLQDAAEISKMQTRRFAKRQLTWFRNQFKHWKMLDTQYLESECDSLVKNYFKKTID